MVIIVLVLLLLNNYRRKNNYFSFSLEESNSNLLSNTPVHVSPINDGPLVETRIEDGKLSYERRWFHRGQSVYIEGKDMPKFPASISAIRSDYVSNYFKEL